MASTRRDAGLVVALPIGANVVAVLVLVAGDGFGAIIALLVLLFAGGLVAGRLAVGLEGAGLTLLGSLAGNALIIGLVLYEARVAEFQWIEYVAVLCAGTTLLGYWISRRAGPMSQWFEPDPLYDARAVTRGLLPPGWRMYFDGYDSTRGAHVVAVGPTDPELDHAEPIEGLGPDEIGACRDLARKLVARRPW